jgi:hypothetical protein
MLVNMAFRKLKEGGCGSLLGGGRFNSFFSFYKSRKIKLHCHDTMPKSIALVKAARPWCRALAFNSGLLANAKQRHGFIHPTKQTTATAAKTLHLSGALSEV